MEALCAEVTVKVNTAEAEMTLEPGGRNRVLTRFGAMAATLHSHSATWMPLYLYYATGLTAQGKKGSWGPDAPGATI